MKKFKKNINSFLCFALYTAILFVVAILLKEFAIDTYFDNQGYTNQFFDITYILNEGAAFGLLPQQSAVLCGVAAFVICMISCYMFNNPKKITNFERFTLAMISAGIISNTLERLKLGAVIDYIDLNFVNFPVFNVADIFICLGICLFLIAIFFKR